MSFAKERLRVRDRVQELCLLYPSTKEDYRKLVQYYWHYVDGLKNFIPLEVFEHLTPPESITRAFRECVQYKMIELPPNVQAKRKSQERKFREHYGRGRQTKIEW